MSTKPATKEVKLFNTLTRQVEPLHPLVPGQVRMYCCGPTVYNFQHIGNMRTYVFEDILVRVLRYAGFNVKHVMNITDVGHLVSDADEGEDKMAVAARREGKKSQELADFYTNVFFEDCSALNIQRPDVVCKATEHIPQMLELIARLERKGFAYQSAGNVYFDVARFKEYGQLAQLNLDQLQAGARIEVDSNKRHPLDFALWFTKSKFENQELQWDSPWGRGYPGWHIECSAMAMHYLGESFDIHCGGIDHIPVHHTNEIAQSEAATEKRFSQVWMHAGFLVLGKDKMSKSAGGFITLDRLREQRLDPISFRMFCLSGSYRNELSFKDEALDGAASVIKKFKNLVSDWREEVGAQPYAVTSPLAKELQSAFEEQCFNDLAMPAAIAVLHEAAAAGQLTAADKLALFEQFDLILGLGVKGWAREDVPQEILDLVKGRDAARLARNWAEADRLRNELTLRGYTLEDSSAGTRVKRV